MIGSVIQQNYGEDIYNHGYGILDIQTLIYETRNLSNPKPFLSFNINSFDDIINGTEKLANI
jgi:hypothetical protein